jgi:catechol 2,3-dioxygenase-like lactoylglutathione lyase family enzyme
MPHELKKLTPNLVVSNVEKSVAFYRDLLGFTLAATVPEASPYVFAIVQSGGVEVFLNAPEPAIAEYPAFAEKPIGGTLTLYIEVEGIRSLYDALQSRIRILTPLEKKFYGVTEFVIQDPDGYLITFGERGEHA